MLIKLDYMWQTIKILRYTWFCGYIGKTILQAQKNRNPLQMIARQFVSLLIKIPLDSHE